MDLLDIVKSYLSNYVSLSEQEFNYLSSLFELRNFEKREKLVEEGEVEKYLNFILQGLARKYFIRSPGGNGRCVHYAGKCRKTV